MTYPGCAVVAAQIRPPPPDSRIEGARFGYREHKGQGAAARCAGAHREMRRAGPVGVAGCVLCVSTYRLHGPLRLSFVPEPGWSISAVSGSGAVRRSAAPAGVPRAKPRETKRTSACIYLKTSGSCSGGESPASPWPLPALSLPLVCPRGLRSRSPGSVAICFRLR